LARYTRYLGRFWSSAEPRLHWGILIFLGIPLLLSGAFPPDPGGDTDLYRDVGEAILAGQAPYRDFPIEYPPGALPAFLLPALFSSEWGGDYRYFFAAEMAVLLVATMLLTAKVSQRLGKPWLPPALVVTVGFSILLVPYRIPTSRYDAVVAFALSAAAWATAVRRFTLAWAFLGLGTLAKLTPGLATAALYPLRQRRLRGTLVFVGVLLAGFIPTFLASPSGFSNMFSYHAHRGLQIESFAASTLLRLDQVEGIAFRYGAVETVGGLSEAAAIATLPLTLALLLITGAVIWRKARRGCLGPAQFPRYAAALLLAFMVGSKVLSPQYLVWLVPLVPLAFRGVWGMGVSALFLFSCGITIPMLYGFYPYHGENPTFIEMVSTPLTLESQQYLSLVSEYSLLGIHPLNILLGRNILLLILWLAMLLAPDGEEIGDPTRDRGPYH